MGRRRSTTPHHITDVALQLFAAGDSRTSASTTSRTPPGSPAARSFVITRPRMPSRGGTSTHTCGTCASCSTRLARMCRWARPCVRRCWRSTRSTSRRPPAPAAHAGDLADRRITGLLDDDVCRVAGGDRRVCGRRTGSRTTDLLPQTVAWMLLGVALSAYEHWLDDESVSLPQALGDAFDAVRDGLDRLKR
ncbi:tetR family transcriptional regulator [Mycobacterium xenopi 4042]|uniref:TetR family transcriptional regulator n=1 Tax=Mycobacterium xenopi 4042 TaxID=1299334 RepID=X7YJN2_MYCXE|nr:tetR family transcriptional regulator [Mycobacterium xenopi 4042]